MRLYTASRLAERGVLRALSLALAALASLGTSAAYAANPDAAHYQRCVLQVAQNPTAALEAAKSWEAEAGGVPAGHCEALALLALKRPEEAAARLESLSMERSSFDDALRADLMAQAGNAWMVAGKADKALTDLGNAINRAGGGSISSNALAGFYSDRARAHLLRGEQTEAQSDLDHSIALSPSPLALTLHARLRRQARDGRGATADISRALALDPNFSEAILERGRLSASIGNIKAARADFLKVVMMEKQGGDVADAARQEIAAMDVKAQH